MGHSSIHAAMSPSKKAARAPELPQAGSQGFVAGVLGRRLQGAGGPSAWLLTGGDWTGGSGTTPAGLGFLASQICRLGLASGRCTTGRCALAARAPLAGARPAVHPAGGIGRGQQQRSAATLVAGHGLDQVGAINKPRSPSKLNQRNRRNSASFLARAGRLDPQRRNSLLPLHAWPDATAIISRAQPPLPRESAPARFPAAAGRQGSEKGHWGRSPWHRDTEQQLKAARQQRRRAHGARSCGKDPPGAPRSVNAPARPGPRARDFAFQPAGYLGPHHARGVRGIAPTIWA